MSISHDNPSTRLTYDDYVLLPDDGNQHEIINGRHYMNAAANPRHQTVSRLIQFQLMQQIEIPGHGQVFNAPIDVQFDEYNVVQPDLVVVMQQNRIVTPATANFADLWPRRAGFGLRGPVPTSQNCPQQKVN